jgi:hypothetical protein
MTSTQAWILVLAVCAIALTAVIGLFRNWPVTRTVTITIPAHGHATIGDLPHYGQVTAAFSAVIDAVDVAWPRGPVPRRVTRALDQLRVDLIELGGLGITTAVVHVSD